MTQSLKSDSLSRARTRAALLAETAERAARWRAALLVAQTMIPADADPEARQTFLHTAAAAIYYGEDR